MPVVLEPESTAQAGDHILNWNVQSWSKKVPQEVIPSVFKLKWLEPRHLVNIENRWSRDRNNDLQHMFFNGIGYTAWENVWGIWNQLTPRDAETLRRIAAIQRQFAPLMVSADWTPYEKTLQAGVFASRFPGAGPGAVDDGESQRIRRDGRSDRHRAHDRRCVLRCLEWRPPGTAHRRRLRVLHAQAGSARIRRNPRSDERQHSRPAAFLEQMQKLSRTPLRSLSAEWRSLPQQLVDIEQTRGATEAPAGMIAIPAAEFDFAVHGIEIEGQTSEGLDIQYPWEGSARRAHRARVRIGAFYIDRYPVTNAQYQAFLDATSYRPRDSHNFLRHWDKGAPPQGWENKPVTWVAIEDARAYAKWAGKRLPREWEWQYAAQGTDARRYPWGNDWNAAAVPPACCEREMPPPDDVDAHPAGASPFGVMDLVGNVWQWTDEYVDAHTRAAILRGGSAYQPQTSHWYFPQAYRLDQHGKYLLMAPCKDRSAGIGFRCVVEAA